MAEYKEIRVFEYLPREDYNKDFKVNKEKIKCYSKKQLDEIYKDTGKEYRIVGETFEKKKRDKDNDIGKIELNEKLLYVSKPGENSKILYSREKFICVGEDEYLQILNFRMLILLGAIGLLLAIGLIILFSILNRDVNDPYIKQIANEIYDITGTVYKAEVPVDGAKLELYYGNKKIGHATTDKDGNYLIHDVKSGSYNLVAYYGNSALTKVATVNSCSIVVDFFFPQDDLKDVDLIVNDQAKKKENGTIPDFGYKSDVKAFVKIEGENTPNIAVGGLEKEALLHMIKGKEVRLTFIAKSVDEKDMPKADLNAIKSVSGEVPLTYLDFKILKEVYSDGKLESKEYLKETKTVLEVCVEFDSSYAIGTYVFRSLNNKGYRFEELAQSVKSNFKDGTYYVRIDYTNIYLNKLTYYAIGCVNGAKKTKGADVITYSDKAVWDLSTGKIQMLYKHDEDSTHYARIELYLGSNSEYLIAKSGLVPPSTMLETMKFNNNSKVPLKVGTYEGLMKIIYINGDTKTDTNVDIPLTITVTK